MEKDKSTPNAARIISAAIIGEDFKVVLVAGKRYVIYPPTIKRLAGAAYHLQELSDLTKIADLLKNPEQLMSAAYALSWLVDGSDHLAEKLAEGTPKELAVAIEAAYQLADVSPFSTLSALSRNVGKLAANTRQ